MSNFKDQYLHPNWQRRRLEILEKHGWRCQACDASEKTLHVHHKRYVKGRKVWEYTDDELDCLCEDCHALTHEQKEAMLAEFARLAAFEVPSAHALLVGFRNGLIPGPGIPEEFVDGRLMDDAPDTLHAYSIGLLARRLHGDFTEPEVSLLIDVANCSIGANLIASMQPAFEAHMATVLAANKKGQPE